MKNKQIALTKLAIAVTAVDIIVSVIRIIMLILGKDSQNCIIKKFFSKGKINDER